MDLSSVSSSMGSSQSLVTGSIPWVLDQVTRIAEEQDTDAMKAMASWTRTHEDLAGKRAEHMDLYEKVCEMCDTDLILLV